VDGMDHSGSSLRVLGSLLYQPTSFSEVDECLSDFLALFGPYLMQPVGEDLGVARKRGLGLN